MTTIEKARQAYKQALANISQEDLERIVSKIDGMGGVHVSYLDYLEIVNDEFHFGTNLSESIVLEETVLVCNDIAKVNITDYQQFAGNISYAMAA